MLAFSPGVFDDKLASALGAWIKSKKIGALHVLQANKDLQWNGFGQASGVQQATVTARLKAFLAAEEPILALRQFTSGSMFLAS